MKKYALRFTAIFAAVALCLSLGTVSFADGAKMSWSYPQPGDDMTYHWEMEKNVSEVDFSDIAMYLSFDVSDSGKQHLVRANWLPEVKEEADTLLDMSLSFYKYLGFQSEFHQASDIYGKDLASLIEESGLSEEEAQNVWYTEIQAQTANTFPYHIAVFDNFMLHGRDLIQGAYGAEAVSVEDGELKGYQMIKACIDYSNIYSGKDFDEASWADINKSIVKNYIYLFDNQAEYMICISGTSDMETLEKIAENLEVYETGLVRNYYNDGMDYIFNDMGKG